MNPIVICFLPAVVALVRQQLETSKLEAADRLVVRRGYME